MNYLPFIATGLFAGILSGFFGIGGGVIVVPVLTLIFGLSQHQAQGTALAAMLPPITLLAALRYYKAGNVNIQLAILISAGLLFGAYLGAQVAAYVPGNVLKKLFGVLLMYVSLRLIILG